MDTVLRGSNKQTEKRRFAQLEQLLGSNSMSKTLLRKYSKAINFEYEADSLKEFSWFNCIDSAANRVHMI